LCRDPLYRLFCFTAPPSFKRRTSLPRQHAYSISPPPLPLAGWRALPVSQFEFYRPSNHGLFPPTPQGGDSFTILHQFCIPTSPTFGIISTALFLDSVLHSVTGCRQAAPYPPNHDQTSPLSPNFGITSLFSGYLDLFQHQLHTAKVIPSLSSLRYLNPKHDFFHLFPWQPVPPTGVCMLPSADFLIKSGGELRPLLLFPRLFNSPLFFGI